MEPFCEYHLPVCHLENTTHYVFNVCFMQLNVLVHVLYVICYLLHVKSEIMMEMFNTLDADYQMWRPVCKDVIYVMITNKQ